MFRRNSSAGATDAEAQDSQGATAQEAPAKSRPAAEAGKGRPTPKRSEAERGRYQSITGTGSRAGSGGSRAPARPRTPEEKQRARADRVTKMEAMKRGEAWALNPADRGPVRALARDYVDSKRRISEYYMYILILMVVYLFVGGRSKAASEFATPLVLALVLVIIVEGMVVRRALDKLVAERLPGQSTRGLTFYAMKRALQIRRFRIPVPRVQPGDKI
jgi:Protein of unknown function (DUF3043)